MPRRVLIVGAGPAGAALSWLLTRNGVGVTLVERERDFERVLRGEALMPTGLDALHQMGLREELDALPWRHLESYDVLWLKLPVPPELRERRPVLIYASGPDALLAYVSWDQRLQVAWMVPKGSWRALRERDWWSELTSLLSPALARHFHAHRDQVEAPVLLDVIVGRCPRWHRPGLLLLGDAAHPMSPIRAQGINLALRDAIVAANHLVPALRGERALPEALEAIQREREPEIVRAQTLQLREARGQRWARERPWLMAPLLRLAPLLARRGWVQRSWLRQQHELRFGVTDVRLEV